MPLPHIQFMPNVNPVRKPYVLAMKRCDGGELTDFIFS